MSSILQQALVLQFGNYIRIYVRNVKRKSVFPSCLLINVSKSGNNSYALKFGCCEQYYLKKV